MVGKKLGFNVSRETNERFDLFSDLTLKWTKRINLISKSSVNEIWNRHIIDSAQIYDYAPKEFINWLDIGSGGGFPGIVMAIIAKEKNPTARFTLIESDQRKCTFLLTAIRDMQLNANVISSRIEETLPQNTDIISARALTSLYKLMPYIEKHLNPSGIALLHKGKNHVNEIRKARESWDFDLEEHISITDDQARIFAIKGIHRGQS